MITLNFHVDGSQGNHNYDMILGREILSKPKIYLCFSDNIIRVNVGASAGCTDLIKDVTNINFNASSAWLCEKSFRNEELWKSEHILYDTRPT